MLQQLLVGAVALVAAAALARKIVRALRPKAGPPACDACAVADHDDATGPSTSR